MCIIFHISYFTENHLLFDVVVLPNYIGYLFIEALTFTTEEVQRDVTIFLSYFTFMGINF